MESGTFQWCEPSWGMNSAADGDWNVCTFPRGQLSAVFPEPCAPSAPHGLSPRLFALGHSNLEHWCLSGNLSLPLGDGPQKPRVTESDALFT